jgi:hypothetical protein
MDIAISRTENCGAERFAFRKRQMQRSDNQYLQKLHRSFSAWLYVGDRAAEEEKEYRSWV